MYNISKKALGDFQDKFGNDFQTVVGIIHNEVNRQPDNKALAIAKLHLEKMRDEYLKLLKLFQS